MNTFGVANTRVLLAAGAVALGAGWAGTAAAEPSLTVYNQNFAVVRETVPLDLKKGVNQVVFTDITTRLEPASVMLRDPAGKQPLQVLEQSYRADAVSQGQLLDLYVGKTLPFKVVDPVTRQESVVQGKILRSGYVPRPVVTNRYAMQMAGMPGYGGEMSQPMVEINGQLQFGLPGTPLFPGLGDDSLLKPALTWQLETDRAGKLPVELSYVTGGIRWEAAYNLVAPEKGDTLDLTGWVTLENQSGRDFVDASVKLMAGDVAKFQAAAARNEAMMREMAYSAAAMDRPPVTEKSFDEYHLYTLTRPTTLRDHETKQVEFIRAAGVASRQVYVYDGVKIDQQRYRGSDMTYLRRDEAYGTQCNPKVWVMREFDNNAKNYLGMPLPKGVVKLYRRDGDGRLEFVGEDSIDHTPKDETVRIFTGNAFDLTGERKRTAFTRDTREDRWVDETFEIRLRNHKTEPVEIRVVEHLYRWANWQIAEASATFLPKDAQTIEFRVQLKPDEETALSYKVHYSW